MESGLVKKAISGDVEALSFLVDHYKDLAFNLAINIVKDEDNAKDITQDSFLKVLENIHKFRNEAKFSTWLYRIIYNQAIAFVQKNGRVNNIDSDNEIHEISTSENIIHEDRNAELYAAINKLDDVEKNIITLFYLAEKSIKEIRTITGLSISNIKVILHRSRKKLHKTLKKEPWTNQI